MAVGFGRVTAFGGGTAFGRGAALSGDTRGTHGCFRNSSSGARCSSIIWPTLLVMRASSVEGEMVATLVASSRILLACGCFGFPLDKALGLGGMGTGTGAATVERSRAGKEPDDDDKDAGDAGCLRF